MGGAPEGRRAGDAAQAAEQARDKLLEAENELVESRSRGAADSFNYPPKVNSRKLASLQSTVAYGDAHPPQQCYNVFKELSKPPTNASPTCARLWNERLRS